MNEEKPKDRTKMSLGRGSVVRSALNRLVDVLEVVGSGDFVKVRSDCN